MLLFFVFVVPENRDILYMACKYVSINICCLFDNVCLLFCFVVPLVKPCFYTRFYFSVHSVSVACLSGRPCVIFILILTRPAIVLSRADLWCWGLRVTKSLAT